MTNSYAEDTSEFNTNSSLMAESAGNATPDAHECSETATNVQRNRIDGCGER